MDLMSNPQTQLQGSQSKYFQKKSQSGDIIYSWELADMILLISGHQWNEGTHRTPL